MAKCHGFPDTILLCCQFGYVVSILFPQYNSPNSFCKESI